MGGYIEVNGLKTYYEEMGGKGNPPLVLMHGGTLTLDTLLGQARELAKDYHVFLPERRGHGRTIESKREKLSYEKMCQDTIAFVEELQLEKAVLIGHSDGANLAMMIAVNRPDLVSKMVLISGNFNPDYLTEDQREEMKHMSSEDFRKMFPAWVALSEKVIPDGKSKYPILFKTVVENLWSSDWRIEKSQLEKIAIPTLVMSGDRDMIPLYHTVELFESIPSAKLAVVPGTSHDLIEEKTDLVNSLIGDFLYD